MLQLGRETDFALEALGATVQGAAHLAKAAHIYNDADTQFVDAYRKIASKWRANQTGLEVKRDIGWRRAYSAPETMPGG